LRPSPPPRARNPAGGSFSKAKAALLGMQALQPHALAVEVVEHPDRDAYRAWWFAKREGFPNARAHSHASSPAVWMAGSDFLGGADDTLGWLRSSFLAGQAVSRPPRVSHATRARRAPRTAAPSTTTSS